MKQEIQVEDVCYRKLYLLYKKEEENKKKN